MEGSTSSPATITTQPTISTTPTSSQVSTTTAKATPQTSIAPASSKYGGVLYWGGTQKLTNLSHIGYQSAIADATYGKPALESLIDVSHGEYIPQLAEKWDIAPDGKSITFYLRKGVKYHDGTDFNAQAVKYVIDIARTGDNTSLRGITSVDVIDDYTVRFNMNQWDWVVMNSLAISIVGKMPSPTSLQKYTREELAYRAVGTGPFKFKNYVRDTSLTYERFENYWQKGLPYLDSIEFRIYADPTTALLALKAGEIQKLSITIQDVEDLKKSGFNIIDYAGDITTLVPDGKNADSPFSDIRVRQAVSYAINRELLAKSLGKGYYKPTYQPFDTTCWAYNPDIIGHPYSPQKAKELLAEAGYPNGFKTRIIVSGASSELHVALQDMLRQVGIDVEIQEVTSPKYMEMSSKGWNGLLNAGVIRWGDHADPVQSLYANYMGGHAQVSVFYPNELKELYFQMRTTPDIETRNKLMQKVTKDIVDTYCMVIHMYVGRTVVALNPKVHDPNIADSFRGFVENIWIER